MCTCTCNSINTLHYTDLQCKCTQLHVHVHTKCTCTYYYVQYKYIVPFVSSPSYGGLLPNSLFSIRRSTRDHPKGFPQSSYVLLTSSWLSTDLWGSPLRWTNLTTNYLSFWWEGQGEGQGEGNLNRAFNRNLIYYKALCLVCYNMLLWYRQ